MATFVLVHGSWHDGSAWEPVITHLEARGHSAFAPTLAGHGKGVDKAVTHAQCTQSIIDYILANDLTDVVLAGHSFGGTIIAKVAEAIPDRVRHLIFANAFVPLDGNCILDEVPPHYRDLFAQLAGASADNTITLPFALWHGGFINDADEAQARAAYEQLSSEPYPPLLEPLDLGQFYTLTIPRSYLNCTEDIALPPGEWGWVPRMSSRLGTFRLVEMPGSHEVIFTNPLGLAEKLIEAGPGEYDGTTSPRI
jgi:pimeloyl-ACP methyl ester carboxylesterase